VATAAMAADDGDQRFRFIPPTLAVGRIRYDGNTVVNPAPFPRSDRELRAGQHPMTVDGYPAPTVTAGPLNRDRSGSSHRGVHIPLHFRLCEGPFQICKGPAQGFPTRRME
jgi:hypothetical protein